MELNEALLTGEISSIDFDLEIDRDRYTQTTILKAPPRCKVYYCFKNDDTREDGEDRCSIDTFNEICHSLAKVLSENTLQGAPALKYSLIITTTDKTKYSFNNEGVASHTIKAIINILSNQIDEYTFLAAFTHFI